MPDYTDAAVAGTSEDGFEKSIIDLMMSENVDGAKKAGNKVALKKFWISAAISMRWTGSRDRKTALWLMIPSQSPKRRSS